MQWTEKSLYQSRYGIDALLTDITNEIFNGDAIIDEKTIDQILHDAIEGSLDTAVTESEQMREFLIRSLIQA